MIKTDWNYYFVTYKTVTQRQRQARLIWSKLRKEQAQKEIAPSYIMYGSDQY